MSCKAVPPILADDSKRRKNLADDTPLWIDKETLSCNIILNIACLLSGKSNAHDYYPTNKPSVSAVLFGFHGTNLLKNLVSREWLRILENFHFSISISKHFDFTFHFSKKSVKALFSLFTSRTLKTHSRWSLFESDGEMADKS